MQAIKYEDREFNFECIDCQALITFKSIDLVCKETKEIRPVTNETTDKILVNNYIDKKVYTIICPICKREHVIKEETINVNKKMFNIDTDGKITPIR